MKCIEHARIMEKLVAPEKMGTNLRGFYDQLLEGGDEECIQAENQIVWAFMALSRRDHEEAAAKGVES